MNTMLYKHTPYILILCSLLSACATQPEKTPEALEPQVRINDFPTRDRVEYVLECIAKNGGLTFTNQNGCTCKIDKIAEKMSYEEYTKARTFTFLRSTPGEKGGIFRDPKQSKDLRKHLQEAEAYAEKKCFIR